MGMSCRHNDRIPANGTKVLCENIPLTGQGMLRIDYAFEGVACVNRCLYGPPPYDAAAYRAWRTK